MTMFRTVFCIAFLLLPSFVLAQTFNVATTAQLRAAFDSASVNGEDDIIILAAGTYKTTDDGLGTFKFSDTETHNLTIKAKDGLTATDVILDGANTHQVLNLTNIQTATFTLERVTIRNGKSASSGGGIYTNQNLTVTNSTISGNNTTTIYGGGIYCETYGSTVTVTNSTISGNTASGWASYGGGIYGSTVTVTNSTISGNTASSSDGGGIYGYTITVTNSTISGNTAGYWGGGICGTYGTITVTNSTISGNTADSGGGIHHQGTVTVTNSTISGNTASYSGGGIYGYTTVTNSTISGNTAGSYGGGIDGTVTVTNSTISGNTAGSDGGGIRGTGTIINNIFNNNSSDIYFRGNSNVYNNYIDYTKLQNEASYTIIKKNNIQPSSGSLNFADSSFRLGAGSVAIDKGLDPNSTTFTNLFTGNTATLTTVQTALQTDKDGNTRIIGSAIDLGAYEYNGASTVNNCAATLSSSYSIHIPILTFNGQYYWADLQYSTGSNFTLSNAGAVTDTSPYSGCTAATLSSSYKLHISALTYNNISYWADLQYMQGTTFTLTGAAAN